MTSSENEVHPCPRLLMVPGRPGLSIEAGNKKIYGVRTKTFEPMPPDHAANTGREDSIDESVRLP